MIERIDRSRSPECAAELNARLADQCIAYARRTQQPWYDAEHAVRRVRSTGEIKWGGENVFISQALAGEPVGIVQGESGDWLVRFASVDLGIIDRRTKKLNRFAAPHPQRGEAPRT